MTGEEAIKYLIKPVATSTEIGEEKQKEFEAYSMAIEALQTIDNCDQCEWCCPSDGTPTIHVVRCKDCRYQVHCYQTVNHTKTHDGFKEHWSEPIEFCSRGERKEP